MESKSPTIIQSILIAVVILVVIIVLSVLLGVMSLPAWPFIFFAFALTTLAQFDKQNWVDTFVGGLIGLIVGLSQIIGTQFFGETVGLIIMAVSVLVILTLVVDGRFKYTNKACLFILTAVSAFATTIPFESILPILGSFLVGVILFGTIIFVMEVNAKKKAEAGGAT